MSLRHWSTVIIASLITNFVSSGDDHNGRILGRAIVPFQCPGLERRQCRRKLCVRDVPQL